MFSLSSLPLSLSFPRLCSLTHPTHPHTPSFPGRAPSPQQQTPVPPTTALVLHVYDHCPFCNRIELVLGWKGIAYERKVYGYGDTLGSSKKGTYYGGRTLTGQKQLPVLEVLRKGEEALLIPESGDIIAYIEGAYLGDLKSRTGRGDLEAFFASKGAFKETQRRLARPRLLKMGNVIADWARPEDVAYARDKYEASGFDYAAAEAAEATDIAAMNVLLVELNDMVRGATCLNEHGNDGASSEAWCGLAWDDLVYLPELRTLSCVQGLVWPAPLESYAKASFARAGLAMYFDVAM